MVRTLPTSTDGAARTALQNHSFQSSTERSLTSPTLVTHGISRHNSPRRPDPHVRTTDARALSRKISWEAAHYRVDSASSSPQPPTIANYPSTAIGTMLGSEEEKASPNSVAQWECAATPTLRRPKEPEGRRSIAVSQQLQQRQSKWSTSNTQTPSPHNDAVRALTTHTLAVGQHLTSCFGNSKSRHGPKGADAYPDGFKDQEVWLHRPGIQDRDGNLWQHSNGTVHRKAYHPDEDLESNSELYTDESSSFCEESSIVDSIDGTDDYSHDTPEVRKQKNEAIYRNPAVHDDSAKSELQLADEGGPRDPRKQTNDKRMVHPTYPEKECMAMTQYGSPKGVRLPRADWRIKHEQPSSRPPGPRRRVTFAIEDNFERTEPIISRNDEGISSQSTPTLNGPPRDTLRKLRLEISQEDLEEGAQRKNQPHESVQASKSATLSKQSLQVDLYKTKRMLKSVTTELERTRRSLSTVQSREIPTNEYKRLQQSSLALEHRLQEITEEKERYQVDARSLEEELASLKSIFRKVESESRRQSRIVDQPKGDNIDTGSDHAKAVLFMTMSEDALRHIPKKDQGPNIATAAYISEDVPKLDKSALIKASNEIMLLRDEVSSLKLQLVQAEEARCEAVRVMKAAQAKSYQAKIELSHVRKKAGLARSSKKIHCL